MEITKEAEYKVVHQTLCLWKLSNNIKTSHKSQQFREQYYITTIRIVSGTLFWHIILASKMQIDHPSN